MTQTVINVGSTANDGTGDTLRGAFANTNNNFTEVYAISTYGSNNANNAFNVANTANTKATIVGPYDTDLEASVNGVPVGGLYYKPQGNVHIRLA
jgi:hypothetical protein